MQTKDVGNVEISSRAEGSLGGGTKSMMVSMVALPSEGSKPVAISTAKYDQGW